jgi:4-aminobutyrate aminotransferase
MRINILTELPGPNAKRILGKNAEFRYPKERNIQYVAERGKGVFQEDVDGNTFLDFAAGIAVLSTGSCHPRVVQAIQQQAAKLIHSGPLYFNNLQVQLAERLATIAPGQSRKRVFLQNSGTEAIEAALKLARYKTKRMGIIGFLNGFHGRSFGAMSVTTSKIIQRQYYSPLLGEIYFTHFPYCYRCPINLEYPGCNVCCLNYIEDIIFKKIISPEEVAAFIVEPIQGEGGYIVPPKEFHPRLKSLAKKYGIIYICDEIQTGMGRTGRMFGIEHWDEVEPDILAFAKGVASGMPLGGIIGTEETFAWAPEVHGSTFGGNIVCCAAALETINIMEEEGLVENARKVGEFIINWLAGIQTKYEIVGDVRGKGLMIGIEIVENKKTKKVAKQKRDKIIRHAFEKGLLILGCGENSIRICPPLIINSQEAEMGLRVLELCIEKVQMEDTL